MFSEAKDDGSGGDNWSYNAPAYYYKSCKAPVKSSPPTNQHPVCFTGWMLFLSPNQQRQSTEWKISHSMDLLTPSSPGGLPTLSLTTNSSWLPWGRVAMPLISPLMPVPHVILDTVTQNLRTSCLSDSFSFQHHSIFDPVFIIFTLNTSKPTPSTVVDHHTDWFQS